MTDFTLSQTESKITSIIAESINISPESIRPESHMIDDLGIDSLDYLDITFGIEETFGIKLPLEQWSQQVNEGKVTTDQFFIVKNLAVQVHKLVEAKPKP